MRTLVLVGKRNRFGIVWMARACAWCGRFHRIRDRVLALLGAKLSHGICPTCAAEFLAKLGPEHDPQRPAA